MADASKLYAGILENMSDGVMTLDMHGQIIMFNPAAEKILGMPRADILNQSFAQVFMMELEGNDDFNQTILDAVYQTSVGERSIVSFKRPDGGESILTVTSSYLRKSRSNKEKNAGVIVVFSDITEMENLRLKEQQLTDDLKAKHAELQESYLKTEEANKNLQAALKKVQVIRIAATVMIIAVFAGTGWFVWNKNLKQVVGASPTSAQDGSPSAVNTITVSPQEISWTVSLPGFLEPLKVENIVSPMSGKVKHKMFVDGERVSRGQPLVEMDTSRIELEYRDAKAAYLKAVQRLEVLRNWRNEAEIQRSRRSLIRAERTLEKLEREVADTGLLFDKGIVSKRELESAVEQLQNAELSYQSATEEMSAVVEKGNAENVEIARLEMMNAKVKKEELEQQLKEAVVKAPVAGVIIGPQGAAKGDETRKSVERGANFEQGQVMLAIGNLEGLSVKSSIDEVEIDKLKVGQKVLTTGDAFQDIVLQGKIANISSQARKSGNVPSFDVIVEIDTLQPEQQKKVRLGMSANLEVVVYHNPQAIMLPVDAVQRNGANAVVTVQDAATGELSEVVVETGVTTLDSVEILKGLTPGMAVVLP